MGFENVVALYFVVYPCPYILLPIYQFMACFDLKAFLIKSMYTQICL